MGAGSNAGTLASTDKTTQVVNEKLVTYVQHTRNGSAVSTPGAARWQVEWTAPESRVNVVFHVAANASNDDASPLGDYVYTAVSKSRPAP